jgi:hypothetical protein
MGILSSILGDRPSTPQTGGFTVGAEIPDELKPFYKDILGKSQALYQDSVSQGYQPYTGPSLAEFTPEQQQAFTGLAGLQGSTAPVFQEAMQMTRDAAAPITTEQIEEYMNPYQQAVVDIEKREAQKQYQSQVVPQLAAKAAMAQPFGGSRQAILEGMAADTQQRLLGDIQAKGSAQAYQDAVNLINNQRTASGQAAGQLATMAPNQFKTQLAEFGALQGVGEEKQKLAQQALNEAYGQYLKEQEYPYQQLGRYQSVVTGAPISTREYVPPVEQPSATNQLLGGLGTLASTYGAFGGFSPGGFMGMNKPAKTGGGIKDLPVIKRQSPGVVYEGDPEFGLGVNTLTNPQLLALEEKRRIQEAINAQRNKNFFSGIKNIFTDDDKAKAIAESGDVYSAENTANTLPKIGEKILQKTGWDIYGRLGKDYLRGGKALATYPYRLMKSALEIPGIETDATKRGDIESMASIDPSAPEGSEVTDKGISAVLKKINVDSKEDSETGPNKVLTENKAKELKELREQQIRLTEAQNKDKKDPVKTDEPDIYADARAAEDAYLEALSGKEKRIQGNLDKLGIQEREAQFGNLAMLFSRLGTKSGSVLSALVESTGEVLPAALKTKNEFAKEERRLKTAVEDAKIGSLKTKADLKKARAKLKTASAKAAFDMEMKEREVQATELKAKAAEWKAKHPDIKMPSDPSKDDKTNAGLLVKSVYDSADPNDRASIDSLIRSNSKSSSPEELTNFINKLSKDETAQFYIAGELERAKVVAEQGGKVLTREEQKEIVGRTIVNLIETNSTINEKADDSWGYRIIPDWLF